MRLVFIIPMVVARLCTLAIAGDVENRTGTGTIVVFNASKDQIVVDADSRTTFLVNGKFVNDDKRCKITTLGHKVVFAVSGIEHSPTLGLWHGRYFDARLRHAAEKQLSVICFHGGSG